VVTWAVCFVERGQRRSWSTTPSARSATRSTADRPRTCLQAQHVSVIPRSSPHRSSLFPRPLPAGYKRCRRQQHLGTAVEGTDRTALGLMIRISGRRLHRASPCTSCSTQARSFSSAFSTRRCNTIRGDGRQSEESGAFVPGIRPGDRRRSISRRSSEIDLGRRPLRDPGLPVARVLILSGNVPFYFGGTCSSSSL